MMDSLFNLQRASIREPSVVSMEACSSWASTVEVRTGPQNVPLLALKNCLETRLRLIWASQARGPPGPFRFRGPAAISFILRDACHDSIAVLFRACFVDIAQISRDMLQNRVCLCNESAAHCGGDRAYVYP